MLLKCPDVSQLMLQLLPLQICILIENKIIFPFHYLLFCCWFWLADGSLGVNICQVFYFSGQQPDAPGENPAGQQPGGGVRKRLHRHQRQLQPLRKVPGDEVHLRGNGGRGKDMRVSAGEIQSHPPGRVNTASSSCPPHNHLNVVLFLKIRETQRLLFHPVATD